MNPLTYFNAYRKAAAIACDLYQQEINARRKGMKTGRIFEQQVKRWRQMDRFAAAVEIALVTAYPAGLAPEILHPIDAADLTWSQVDPAAALESDRSLLVMYWRDSGNIIRARELTPEEKRQIENDPSSFNRNPGDLNQAPDPLPHGPIQPLQALVDHYAGAYPIGSADSCFSCGQLWPCDCSQPRQWCGQHENYKNRCSCYLAAQLEKRNPSP